MTDLLSSLAQSYHRTSTAFVDGIPKIRHYNDPAYLNLEKMLKPLQQTLDQSPFQDKKKMPRDIIDKENSFKFQDSPQKNQRTQKQNSRLIDKSINDCSNDNKENGLLLHRCEDSNKNLMVHVSIAENIFKEIKNQENAQNRMSLSALAIKKDSSCSKLKMPTQLPIATPVHEYIKQRQSVLKEKVERMSIINQQKRDSSSSNNHQNINIQKNLAQKEKFQQKIKSVNKSPNIKYQPINLQRQSVSKSPFQKNQQSQVKPQIQQTQTEIIQNKEHKTKQAKENFNSQEFLQNYQSTQQHYRSRSSIGILQQRELQSTQLLQDIKHSPSFQRIRQSSVFSQISQDNTNNQAQLSCLDKNICDSIRDLESLRSQHDSKFSFNLEKSQQENQGYTQIFSQRSSISNIFKKTKDQEIIHKTIQDIINETGKISLQPSQPGEFRLTMTPIKEVTPTSSKLKNNNQVSFMKNQKQLQTRNRSRLNFSKTSQNTFRK